MVLADTQHCFVLSSAQIHNPKHDGSWDTKTPSATIFLYKVYENKGKGEKYPS